MTIELKQASQRLNIAPRTSGSWKRPIIKLDVMHEVEYVELDRCAQSVAWGMDTGRFHSYTYKAVSEMTPYQCLKLILSLQQFVDMMDMVRFVNAKYAPK